MLLYGHGDGGGGPTYVNNRNWINCYTVFNGTSYSETSKNMLRQASLVPIVSGNEVRDRSFHYRKGLWI